MPRDVSQLEDFTLPELLPGVIDEIAKLDTFSAALYPRIIVTSRPSIKFNRLINRGSATWNDGSCEVSTSSPSSAPAQYNLELTSTAFDVCMPHADIYSDPTSVVGTELEQGVLRMVEHLNEGFINGTGLNGQISGLDNEITQSLDTATYGGDILKTLDAAYQSVRPRRDMVWVLSPEAEIEFNDEIRGTAGGDKSVDLWNGIMVPSYRGIPVTVSENVAANEGYLVSLASEGFNVRLGRRLEASSVGGVFGLRGPIQKQGSLVDQWQIYANVASYLVNRQTGVKIVNIG